MNDLTLTETDNRGPNETRLTMEDSDGNKYYITVDPVDLFNNMVDNIGNKPFEMSWNDLMGQLDSLRDPE